MLEVKLYGSSFVVKLNGIEQQRISFTRHEAQIFAMLVLQRLEQKECDPATLRNRFPISDQKDAGYYQRKINEWNKLLSFAEDSTDLVEAINNALLDAKIDVGRMNNAFEPGPFKHANWDTVQNIRGGGSFLQGVNEPILQRAAEDWEDKYQAFTRRGIKSMQATNPVKARAMMDQALAINNKPAEWEKELNKMKNPETPKPSGKKKKSQKAPAAPTLTQDFHGNVNQAIGIQNIKGEKNK